MEWNGVDKKMEKYSLSITQMESNTGNGYTDQQNQAEEHLTRGHDGDTVEDDGIVVLSLSLSQSRSFWPAA